MFVILIYLQKSDISWTIKLKKESFLAIVHNPKDIGYIIHTPAKFRLAGMLYLMKMLHGIGSRMILIRNMW